MKILSSQNIPRSFEFASMLFLNIYKEDKENIALGILRFASIVFEIFEKGDQEKFGPGCFEICNYIF